MRTSLVSLVSLVGTGSCITTNTFNCLFVLLARIFAETGTLLNGKINIGTNHLLKVTESAHGGAIISTL